MTIAPQSDGGVLATPSFDRALARRAHEVWLRCGQATLIGLLGCVATGRARVAVWLVVALALAVLEACVSRWQLRRPRTRGGIAVVCVGHVACATGFAALGPVLLSSPSPLRLAETMLVLCAACLNNAMMSAGSKLSTVMLVGPPAIMLAASPILAAALGYEMTPSDTALLCLAGGAFTVFIVRIAATFNAEGLALKRALESLAGQTATAVAASEEAEGSRHRWRMIFEASPLARVCFNASALHEVLGPGADDPDCRLGDLVRARFDSVASIFAHIKLVEANHVAIELCGEELARAHFTDASLDAFCEALNHIGPDGVVPVFPGELICANGEILEVDVHYRVADQGLPWSLCLATYVDVTESRRAVREQREALKAAEVANRAKSDFLAVMSHEIRTPLNGVLGMAQAMSLSPLGRVQRERLRVISESGAALLAIVDDLLDLSKIEAGHLSLTSTDFDLRGLVESLHAAYAAEAARKGLAFVLDVQPEAAGRFRGDAGRVRQVIGNLISNALKFTHKGEVRVRVSRTARGVRCEVRDTGIGIAPNRAAKLFEKFVQADSSLTRRYGGTGLGLAICQQLCVAMGGEISLVSTPGEGSTFVFEAPLQPSPGTMESSRDDLAAASNGSVRVLVAEDNEVNRLVLKALLAQVGVEPTIVENGLEAVQAWETGDWDLILMDVQMPLMDGPSAARMIRAREVETGRAPTPIIAVTANAMIHQVASYRAAGMNDVISKPIDVEALFSTMVGAITRGPHAAQDEARSATGS